MEERLGAIEINGKTYPLNYSMRIAQRYNDIAEENISGDFAFMERNMKILALLMDDGAAFRKMITGEETELPSFEELRLLLTPADSERVAAAIIDTLKRGGIRFVEAEPGKNTEAGPERKAKSSGKRG